MTVSAPPERNPDIVSFNCSSFLASLDNVGDVSVVTADAVVDGAAFAGEDAMATRAAAENDRNDERDIPRSILPFFPLPSSWSFVIVPSCASTCVRWCGPLDGGPLDGAKAYANVEAPRARDSAATIEVNVT